MIESKDLVRNTAYWLNIINMIPKINLFIYFQDHTVYQSP